MLSHSGEQFNQVYLCASACFCVCPLLVPVCFLFVCASQQFSPPHFLIQSIALALSWSYLCRSDCFVCSCHTGVPLSPPLCFPAAAWHSIQPVARRLTLPVIPVDTHLPPACLLAAPWAVPLSITRGSG